MRRNRIERSGVGGMKQRKSGYSEAESSIVKWEGLNMKNGKM